MAVKVLSQHQQGLPTEAEPGSPSPLVPLLGNLASGSCPPSGLLLCCQVWGFDATQADVSLVSGDLY